MPSKIGQKIRKHRKEAHLSLQNLAEITESTKSYIWGLENNDNPNPTIEKLTKISLALNITIDYLMNDSELSDIMLEKAFLRKFNQLSDEDKKRIQQIIELWVKC